MYLSIKILHSYNSLAYVKNKTITINILMTAICQLHYMHLQKEVKSNQKQPSNKKMCGPCCEKRCKIQGGGVVMVS